MIALFVHGMARTPFSGWPMLHALRKSGIKVETFRYSSAAEHVSTITSRLTARLKALSSKDRYVVIGHSLGGVLLRAAVQDLPPDSTKPAHVFLLGSPIQASRLALRLAHNTLFRVLTGECGQLLGSADRMAHIGRIDVPTTAIVGVRGISWKSAPFYGEPNDGIVSVSEAQATWFDSLIKLRVIHSLLPASTAVAAEIKRVLIEKKLI